MFIGGIFISTLFIYKLITNNNNNNYYSNNIAGIRAQNHALGLRLCPMTFRLSKEGRMVIRNSNLKSCKEGSNGGLSEGESLLRPNQRNSSMDSSR